MRKVGWGQKNDIPKNQNELILKSICKKKTFQKFILILVWIYGFGILRLEMPAELFGLHFDFKQNSVCNNFGCRLCVDFRIRPHDAVRLVHQDRNDALEQFFGCVHVEGQVFIYRTRGRLGEPVN